MTEIITESFCERCGTRYTFEAAIPKKRRIGKLKVLSKGLKNYVLSDDASLDEALAEARSDEQRELSGGQLDAFHQTFQFCMSCRQYTCANCWNEPEGRCLTCAPLSVAAPGLLRSPLDDLLAGGGMSPLVSPDPVAGAAPAEGQLLVGAGPLDEVAPAAVVGSAWPTIDLFRAPDAEPTAEASEMAAEPELAAEGAAEAREPAAQAEAVPEPAEQAELASAAEFWMRPFTGYAPVAEPTNGNGNGHHHDEPATALAAEAVIVSHEPDAAVAPAAEPEAAAIAEVVPEPVSEPVAVAEPEPEPVAVAEPEPEPRVAEPEPVASLPSRSRLPSPSPSRSRLRSPNRSLWRIQSRILLRPSGPTSWPPIPRACLAASGREPPAASRRPRSNPKRPSSCRRLPSPRPNLLLRTERTLPPPWPPRQCWRPPRPSQPDRAPMLSRCPPGRSSTGVARSHPRRLPSPRSHRCHRSVRRPRSRSRPGPPRRPSSPVRLPHRSGLRPERPAPTSACRPSGPRATGAERAVKRTCGMHRPRRSSARRARSRHNLASSPA